MNLYVGNLPRTVTEADLELIFDGFGYIVFARLGHETGRAGHAFVRVDDEEQARAAIEALNGTYLKGASLIVRRLIDHRAARRPTARRSHRRHSHLRIVGAGRPAR